MRNEYLCFAKQKNIEMLSHTMHDFRNMCYTFHAEGNYITQGMWERAPFKMSAEWMGTRCSLYIPEMIQPEMAL